MTSIIHEIATEFLENILETLKPHEGMKWEEISAKLMKYCKETTARFIRAAAEGLDQELRNDKAGRKQLGLTIKARGRKRTIYTEFGAIGTHRNATVEPVSFVDEYFNTERLWKTVEGFIEKKYDLDVLEKIVLHGDGGNWIRNGLDDFCNVVHVMDGFHFQKALRTLAANFPKRRVKKVIMDAVKENDQSRVDRCIQELLDDAKENKDLTEKVNRFGVYLNRNWKAIVNRFKKDMPGSCTEGLVSHILSKRFSREPQGWSDGELGRLSNIRVYLINGGELKVDDLHKERPDNAPREKYAEYADRVIQHARREPRGVPGMGCVQLKTTWRSVNKNSRV